MIKIKNAKVINTGLILISLLMGLLVCELVLRIVSHESDMMPMIPTPDPILGWRLPPLQSGLYARGFRNITAEGDFPIVCIGDSMIYGAGLPFRYAVPQQMSLMLGEKSIIWEVRHLEKKEVWCPKGFQIFANVIFFTLF